MTDILHNLCKYMYASLSLTDICMYYNLSTFTHTCTWHKSTSAHTWTWHHVALDIKVLVLVTLVLMLLLACRNNYLLRLGRHSWKHDTERWPTPHCHHGYLWMQSTGAHWNQQGHERRIEYDESGSWKSPNWYLDLASYKTNSASISFILRLLSE